MAKTIKQKQKAIPAALELSAEDREHLAEFNEQRAILSARVEAVAERASNSLIVHGLAGVGKSRTIDDTLNQLGIKYILRKGWMTAKGLYDTIEANPASIIVLDDMHELLYDKAAKQLLLAALGGEVGDTREIHYTKHGAGPDGGCVYFSGGIIAISNMTIPNTPLREALVRRVNCFEFNPTQRELAAVLRDYANRGYSCAAGKMTPTECRKVVELVLGQVAELSEVTGAEHRVNYGTINKAFGDYLSRRGKDGPSWEALVLSDLRSAPPPQSTASTATKKGRLEIERIQFLKAYAQNAKLPEADQLSVEELSKQQCFGKSKAYGFLSGK